MTTRSTEKLLFFHGLTFYLLKLLQNLNASLLKYSTHHQILTFAPNWNVFQQNILGTHNFEHAPWWITGHEGHNSPWELIHAGALFLISVNLHNILNVTCLQTRVRNLQQLHWYETVSLAHMDWKLFFNNNGGNFLPVSQVPTGLSIQFTWIWVF